METNQQRGDEMARKTFELKNDFHNTSVRVKPVVNDGYSYVLTRRQVRRARRALCGVDGCTCGSIRPAKWAFIEVGKDEFRLILND